ncbi:MAG: prolipoprotein diacylglyceryl transferase family protein [Aristaeellaceae bacterium]
MTSIHLGSLTLYPYGLALCAATALALGLAALAFRRNGLKAGALSWFGLLAIPLGILGARLAYCLAALDWVVQEGFGFFLQLTRGGYMLYGALGGCALALWLTARITGESFARMADRLAVPAMVLLLLGRLAEGLVGQGYGWCVEDWFMEDSGMSLFVMEDPSFFYRLPFAVADMYDNYNWAVFIFEALLAGVMALILLRTKARKDGGRAALALLLYAAAQVLCESLRQDAVLRWGFVRINQVIGAVLIAGLMLLCALRSPHRRSGQIAGLFAGMLACMGVVIAMEFALEKKISAIEFIPMDVCYVLMALACLGLILCVAPLWRRAFPRED